LVLDDILNVILDIRTQFKLPNPQFGLKQIESVAGARKALSEIIETTKKRHGPEICSKGHTLLGEFGPEVYAERIKGRAFSEYRRISPAHMDGALRRVFEIALQTLFQLPARDLRVQRANDKLVSLASQFSNLAKKADPVVRTDKRIRVYLGLKGSAAKRRLRRVPAELQWASELLTLVSSETQVVRLPIDSPNPQVRFALYLAGWIETCTGRKHYKQLQALAAAAFAATDSHREPPKWVNRLEIEMNRKMIKRRRWPK
jgi:hypothetical protein